MKVILIDDDKIVTNSLAIILKKNDIDVCCVSSEPERIIELYETHQPDIVVTDIRMESMNGIDAAKMLLEKYPEAKVVFLSTFEDPKYYNEARVMGAYSYVLKQEYETLNIILNTVLMGLKVFKDAPQEEMDALTEQEQVILTLIAEGLNNKEIAEKIHLGEGTIRNYISSMLDKLQLRDRTQLAIYYYKK